MMPVQALGAAHIGAETTAKNYAGCGLRRLIGLCAIGKALGIKILALAFGKRVKRQVKYRDRWWRSCAAHLFTI